MILRTPVILGMCWWIGLNTAIPFRKTPKNIEEDIRQVNHLLEDQSPKDVYQDPKYDKHNHMTAPEIQKDSDNYPKYGSTEEEYYTSQSSEAYPDQGENYPNSQKTSQYISQSSSDVSQIFNEISKGSRDDDQISDSAEDYSQSNSDYSDEDKNPEGRNPPTTSEPADSPDSETVKHLPEKNVIEKWIPTNCTHSTRKSSDRYSSSFVSNNTKDDLNEDTFPNPGEAEAVKRSSVFIGEDVTLCWIETITIKEDKSIKPSKKVVLREFTISFENSATIPEKYLECGKLEGEVEPGCHENSGKSGMFDVIDEDSKVSKLVNFTTISNKGNIEVRQHKNVRCAVGPVVTKNVIEFNDGTKNPKKRVEVKVSPRLRRMSEAGESCPSDKEENENVPGKTNPEVKDLLLEYGKKSKEKPKDFDRVTRKPDEVSDEVSKESKEGPDDINKKLEELHSSIIRPKFMSKTMLEPIVDNGSSTTYKEEIPDVENTSTAEPSRPPEEVQKTNNEIPTTGSKNFEDRGYSSTPKAESEGSTEKTPVLKEETTRIPKGIQPRKGNESKNESEYCEGDSCEECSGEDCSRDSQSVEGSGEGISVTDKSRKDSTTEKTIIGRQISTTEIADDILREGSTTKEPTTTSITEKFPSGEIGTPIHINIPSEDDKKTETGTEKSTTNSPPNVEEIPSEKEFGAIPDRKSSSRDVSSSDIDIESSTPDTLESDSKKSEENPTSIMKHVKLDNFQRSEQEGTSLRPMKDETDIPDSGKDGPTKRPEHISSHNLIREEGPKKDLKCESGSCSTSLEGLAESTEGSTKLPKEETESNEEGIQSPVGRTEPSDVSKSEDSLESPEESSESYQSKTKSSTDRPKSKGVIKLTESLEESSESPESTTKSPKNVSKSKLILRSNESSEEASESLSSTTKFSEVVTNPTQDTSKSTKHPESTTNSPRDLLTSGATTQFPEGVTKYPKERSEPEDIGEDVSKDLEEASTIKPNTPERKEHKKKDRKYEPDDIGEMTNIYSDEEESTSETPSFPKTPPSTKQSRKFIENSSSELKNRSGEEFPDEVPKKSTETSLIEKTTAQCSPDDKECVFKYKTSTTEPVSDDCNSENSENCTSASKDIKNESKKEKEIDEGKDNEEVKEMEKVIKKVEEKEKDEENNESNDQSSTPSNLEAELATNKSIPNTSDEKSVSELSSRGKHRLGLRIKILLEHINEKEERNNLVEVDKHLLLNENAKEHDNNTILNQIRALNDSVTAQTIKALLNCTTLEKLANKGISIKVDEAKLLPKGKENSKNVEPNQFILSVEDKTDGVDKLRNKREISIDKDIAKIGNSTGFNSTEENSSDVNSTDNFKEAATTEINSIQANNTSKNQSEIIKDCLPDLKKDINAGMNHVISKLKNCSTSNCFQESEDLNPLPISDILGIISDPKDSRIGSRNKRHTEVHRTENVSLEKLDHWSNERIRRAAAGHHLRSLTEFTIFKASV